MNEMMQYLPLIIPLVVIQLGLMAAALLDLYKRERVRGKKIMWVFIVVFINFLGPIAYFVIGREEM